MSLFDSLAGSTLTGSLGGAGLALGAIGAIGGIITGEEEAKVQAEAAGLSQKNAQLALKANQARTQQMYLQANRSQMENFRNTARAAAMGRAASASSGSIYGSAFGGGQATVKESGGVNKLNTAQNLQIGGQLSDITQQQGMNNVQIAGLMGQAATLQGQGSIFQGISGFGGGLVGGAKAFGNVFAGGPGQSYASDSAIY